MTPRSRKPVIIGGAMLAMADENYHKSIMNYVKDDVINNATPDKNQNRSLNVLLQKSKSESDLLAALNESLLEKSTLNAIKIPKSTSDETLSTPFR